MPRNYDEPGELASVDDMSMDADAPESTPSTIAETLRNAWHEYTDLPATKVRMMGVSAVFEVTDINGVDHQVRVWPVK